MEGRDLELRPHATKEKAMKRKITLHHQPPYPCATRFNDLYNIQNGIYDSR